MSLEEIYYIGQTVAVVAILASLVGIFVQQRQANRIAQVQNIKLFDVYGGAMRAIMENSELAEAFRKVMFDDVPITPVERTRILLYFSMMLTSHRDIWIAQKNGLADSFAMDQLIANTSWHLSKEIFLKEWRRLQASGHF